MPGNLRGVFSEVPGGVCPVLFGHETIRTSTGHTLLGTSENTPGHTAGHTTGHTTRHTPCSSVAVERSSPNRVSVCLAAKSTDSQALCGGINRRIFAAPGLGRLKAGSVGVPQTQGLSDNLGLNRSANLRGARAGTPSGGVSMGGWSARISRDSGADGQRIFAAPDLGRVKAGSIWVARTHGFPGILSRNRAADFLGAWAGTPYSGVNMGGQKVRISKHTGAEWGGRFSRG